MMNDKPFNVIKSQCPEFYEWLKEISRYSKVENFIQPDYKNGIRVSLYTHNFRYNISVRPKAEYKEEREGKDGKIISASNSPSYLLCTVLDRKPVAGEDWQRGRDLADGRHCYETWQRIKDHIIAFELVKVAKPKEEIYKKGVRKTIPSTPNDCKS